MKTSDFYYDLPEELIAQVPLQNRSDSRLMVLDKHTGAITHSQFKNIRAFLIIIYHTYYKSNHFIFFF